MAIGEKLDELIKSRHTNVNQLASTTGINVQTIYSIIRRNNTKVDLDVLQVLADELCVTLDYFAEKKDNSGDQDDHFAEIVVGRSMEPRLYDGDIAIVHSQNDVSSGDIAVVKVKGERTTKKIVKQENGILLVGLNAAAFTPESYSYDDVEILGKVVEVRGKMDGWNK